jgi:hypothetical protein
MADPLAFPSVYDAPGLDEEERKRQERFRSQFADPFAAPDPADRVRSTMSAAFAPGFAPAGTQPFASPFAVPRPAPPVIDQDKLAAVFPTAGLNPSQAAQMATEARGDIPGTPGLGAGRQVAVQMGPYNQFLHTIDDVGGQTVKQVGAPPVVTDPLEKVRQVFRDRQANGPNMGFDAAGQMAGAQLSTLDEAMRGQTAIDVARAKHELDNNPAALRTKAYSNVFGALYAETGDANAAHAGAVKAAAAFNPGAPTPAGPVTSSTDISPKAFTKQNLDILPTAFSYQGPGDKVAYRGQAEAFGPKQTAELVSRMMLLPEDQQKLELAKLMNSPAGPQISNALAARFGSAYATTLPKDMPRDVGTVMGLAPGVEVKNVAPRWIDRFGREAPFGGTTDPRYKLNRVVSKVTGREVPLDSTVMGDEEAAKKIMETEAPFMQQFWPHFAPQTR